jgi:hypothetical protein
MAEDRAYSGFLAPAARGQESADGGRQRLWIVTPWARRP